MMTAMGWRYSKEGVKTGIIRTAPKSHTIAAVSVNLNGLRSLNRKKSASALRIKKRASVLRGRSLPKKLSILALPCNTAHVLYTYLYAPCRLRICNEMGRRKRFSAPLVMASILNANLRPGISNDTIFDTTQISLGGAVNNFSSNLQKKFSCLT